MSNVLFGNGMFLASTAVEVAPRVYQSLFYGSTDGLTWRKLGVIGERIFTLAAFGQGVFVAQTLDSARRIMTSRDGQTWSTVYTGPHPGIASPAYAAFAAGQFIILAPYAVLTSPDGYAWTERQADAAAALAEESIHPSLAYGRGTFVSVGKGNVQQSLRVGPALSLSVSADPSTAPELGPEPGRFKFMCADGAFSEADLTVRFELGGTGQNGVDYVQTPGEVVIRAGQTSAFVPITPIPNRTSPSSRTVTATLLPSDVYAVAPPATATIQIQDADIPPQLDSVSVRRSETGAVALAIDSFPGAMFSLEASSDLVNWQVLTNAASPSGFFEFTDFTSSDSPQRFYRARLIPDAGSLLQFRTSAGAAP